MDKPLFFSGQNVTQNDMQDVVGMTYDECVERLLALTTTQGIVTGCAVTSIGGVPGPFTLQVTAGYGYTRNGERVELLGTQTIVASPPGDVGKYLVLQWSETPGTPIAHPVTGVLNNTRNVNGTALLLLAGPLPISDDVIVLCRVASVSGSPPPYDVVIDETVREVLSAARVDPNDEIAKHADRNNPNFYQGTGVLAWVSTNPHHQHVQDLEGGADLFNFATYHQQRMHHGGVVGDSATAAPSLPGAGPNDLVIGAIPSGSYLHADGAIIEPRIAQNYTFGAPPGVRDHLWIVGVDSAGTIVIFDRASRAAATISNCWISWVSQNMNTTGIKNLVYTYTSPTVKTLAWAGGPAVAVQDSGGRYRLWAADMVSYVEVEIIGVLPGSTQTDGFTLTPLPADLYTKALICTINQDYTGPVVAGTLRDIRSLGTTGWRELSSQVFNFDLEQPADKRPDFQMVAEIDVGFVVHGLAVNSVVPPNVAVDGGICWINGLRLVVPGGALLTSGDGVYYVYATHNGTLAISKDPVDLRTAPVSGKNYLLLHQFTISGGVVTVSRDQRHFGYNSLSHPVLEDGTIGGPPTFRYGMTVAAGGVVTLPSGPDTLVGQVVYEDNLAVEILGAISARSVKSVFQRFAGDGSDGTPTDATHDLGALSVKQYVNVTLTGTNRIYSSASPFLILGVSGTLDLSGVTVGGGIVLAGSPGGAGSIVWRGGIGGYGPGGDGGNGAGYHLGQYFAQGGKTTHLRLCTDGGNGTAGVDGGAGTARAIGMAKWGGGGGGADGGVSSGGAGGAAGSGGAGGAGGAGNNGRGVLTDVLGPGIADSTVCKFLSATDPNLVLENQRDFFISGPLGFGGGGAGGGSGATGADVTAGGGGGGGGAIVVECDTLVLPSGSPVVCFNAGGGAGGLALNASYFGGGGGGGGTILVIARQVLFSPGVGSVVPGYFNISGGLGGSNGSVSSGAGAPGLLVVINFADFPHLGY